MKGEWRIKCGEKRFRLESGVRCWRAESAPKGELTATCTGRPMTIQVFWKRLDDDKYDGRKGLSLTLNADGKFGAYKLDLSSSPEYRGLITGLAIEPVAQPKPGEEIVVKSIVLVPERR